MPILRGKGRGRGAARPPRMRRRVAPAENGLEFRPVCPWKSGLSLVLESILEFLCLIGDIGCTSRRDFVLQSGPMSAVLPPVNVPPGTPATADRAPAFSPLYQQIKARMVASLQRTEWRPGEAIPSETELAVRFKVSQGTVRKAIEELAAENLLVRRQGKGTFVATHAEQRVQFRFLRLTPDEGEPAGMDRRLIDCRRVRAPADVARALQLRTSDPVIRVRRVLSVRGRPVVLDDIWLPANLFKGL